MNFYSAPFWIRAIYPKGLIWRAQTRKQEVFLTFDDGPVPEVTPLVLRILKKYNIRATFFCVGENVQKYPEIFDLLLKDGHAIGNHTYHHIKAWKTDNNMYLSEVEQCSRLVKSRLFRPPHGQINRKIARQLRKDYRIIMWSALTGDYNKKLSGDQCLANAIGNTAPGSIIVFHDSLKARERMEYALPLYIEYCLEKGYSFGRLK
ncbi:MAG: polysaccharide deacetylase family protein [Lentimicrobiaceae bacterium]|jgi:peptidoglycan/xylan/chitin deacetylase (PgdA/CDA1 family)